MPSTKIGQSNARVIEYAACFARASGQDRLQATPGASVIPVPYSLTVSLVQKHL